MKSLAFTPVLQSAGEAAATNQPICLIHRNLNTRSVFALRLPRVGDLRIERVELDDGASGAVRRDSSIVALLYGGLLHSWILIARSARLGVNEQTPALPVTALEPGELIAIGERSWMISSLWQPELVEAPAELRDKPCPVCGGELGMARVVQCACGRWSHLEHPKDADDPNALNCFLKAGVCGECGRSASLEPQIVPEVPISLTSSFCNADE